MEKSSITIIPTCTYCGAKWPKLSGDVALGLATLQSEGRQHMQNCEKNPLVAKIKELRKIISVAFEALCTKDPETKSMAINLIKALEPNHVTTNSNNNRNGPS